MRSRWRLFFALSVAFAVLASPTRADAVPSTPRAAFAVVIGNNRSLASRRPDLHYADDDAAKYFDILRTIAPDDVFLLADFDRDTERLFPDERAHASPPSRAELLRVGAELARRVRSAANRGQETDVYFVFAGHGDVDEGSGFIELLDSRFTAADLEAWLRAIPFSRAHVILDSCNSFFMLGARRPGGSYFATPLDAARSLSARLPNVGVLLSTSAEGEVFEWSELQSGIFSHVVRSGLLGAADSDGDGLVSYLEMAAFVATATADVKNPNMRPQVFARGPGGRDDVPIMSVAPRRAVRTLRFSDADPLRVRIRDREGLPLLDTHAEAGHPFAIGLPASWAPGATLERAMPPANGRSSDPQLFSIPERPTDLTLASLEPLGIRGTVRGPDAMFQSLFARPFGPRAVSSYVLEMRSSPPPVYGVSREDAERMQFLLDQIESAERGQRLLTGSVLLGAAAVLGVAGGTELHFARSLAQSQTFSYAAGGLFLGISALYAGFGAITLAEPWGGEIAARDYRVALGEQGDYARAFAVAEERLREMSARDERGRWIARSLGAVVAVGSMSAIVYGELAAQTAQERLYDRVFGGTGVLLGATVIAASYFIQSPTQRLMTIWERDPGMLRLQPVVAPTQGGAILGLVGRF
ncbi:MAG TPA: hypothetical protein VEK07_12300 [Polyangiaceae bacterium]|nr:hypothetical protein [Polyangiaceae bacterium]